MRPYALLYVPEERMTGPEWVLPGGIDFPALFVDQGDSCFRVIQIDLGDRVEQEFHYRDGDGTVKATLLVNIKLAKED
jgi:hypothetical protein